jgi:hypothetical protein
MYYWDQPVDFLEQVCSVPTLAMVTKERCSASCGGGVQNLGVHPLYQKLAKAYGCPLQKQIICEPQACGM